MDGDDQIVFSIRRCSSFLISLYMPMREFFGGWRCGNYVDASLELMT